MRVPRRVRGIGLLERGVGVDPLGLHQRQESVSAPMPTGSPGAAAEAGGDTSKPARNLSISVIIPLACILGLLLLFALVWAIRGRLFSRTGWEVARTPPSGHGSAEELAGRGAGQSEGGRAGGESRETTESISLIGPRASRARRARRHIRRTESGRSIRTLPEYSKEAGDEELVLVRQRSASSIEEVDEDEGVDEAGGRGESAVQRIAARRSSTPSSRSMRSVGSTRDVDHPVAPPSDEVVVADEPASLYRSGSRSAPLYEAGGYEAGGFPGPSSGSVGGRRAWGEVPTYLEAMSSPPIPPFPSQSASPLASLEAGVPPPRTPPIHSRAPTSFRDLLHKGLASFRPSTGMAAHSDASRSSSLSLLLQPLSSRLSTGSAASRDALGTGRGGGEGGGADGSSPAPSQPPSPWASTHSLGSTTPRHISSPLPDSAVRVSFETAPKAGLSADQVRFLGSSEAVTIAGVRLRQVPPDKRRRRRRVGEDGGSSLPAEEGGMAGEAAPPRWDEVQESSRVDASPRGVGESRSRSARLAESQRLSVERPDSSSADGPSSGHVSSTNAPSTDVPSTDVPSTDVPASANVPASASVPPSAEKRRAKTPTLDDTAPSPTVHPPPPTASSSAPNPSLEVEPPTPMSAAHGDTAPPASSHPSSSRSVDKTDSAQRA